MTLTYSDIESRHGFTVDSDEKTAPKQETVTAWISDATAAIRAYDPDAEINSNLEDSIVSAYCGRRLQNWWLFRFNKGGTSHSAEDRSAFSYPKIQPPGLLPEEISLILADISNETSEDIGVYAQETY